MLSHLRLTAVLDRFLPFGEIEDLARTTGFTRRCRFVQPRPWLLVLTFASKEALSFSALAARYGVLTKRALSKQAFRKRLLSAVPFVTAVVSSFLQLAMRSPGLGRLGGHQGAKLAGIARVLAIDSSIQTLKDALSTEFAGAGGDAGNASLRLHVSYDLTNDNVTHLEATSSLIGEQKVLRQQLNELRPNDLVLTDLGYFNLSFFAALSQRRTHFISKLPMNIVEAYDDAGRPFDLWQWLEHVGEAKAERGLWLGRGEDKLLCRAAARRLNRKDHRARIKKLNDERRRKGKPLLTLEMRRRSRWLVFITSLPKATYSADQVFDLYRLRWQIELVFKTIKSHAGFAKLASYKRPEVLKVMLYLRLLQALFSIVAHREVQRREDDEVMLLKWSGCLSAIAEPILLHIFQGETDLAARLLLAMAHANCRRESRRRPTSRGRIARWETSPPAACRSPGDRGQSKEANAARSAA